MPPASLRLARARGDQLRPAVDVLVDVLPSLVSPWTRASSVAKKARPSLAMKRPSWLAATSEVGGSPLGMQETQTIVRVDGS